MLEIQQAVDRDSRLRDLAEELGALDRILDQHPRIEPSSGFIARVESAVKADATRRRWRPWVAGLAAASLLAAIGFLWNPFAAESEEDMEELYISVGLAEIGGEQPDLEKLVSAIEWIDEEFLPLN